MLMVQDFPMSRRKVDPSALPAGSQVSPETVKLSAPLLLTKVHASPVSIAVADWLVRVIFCAAEVAPGDSAGKLREAGSSVNGCWQAVPLNPKQTLPESPGLVSEPHRDKPSSSVRRMSRSPSGGPSRSGWSRRSECPDPSPAFHRSDPNSSRRGRSSAA